MSAPKPAPKGTLSMVLHHHLPYIRHPEHPFFLEERWLFEAICETYLPLIEAWRRLEADGIDACFTLSMTPPLANMLEDGLLMQRFRRHLDGLRELADKEVRRTQGDHDFHRLARFYEARFAEQARLFDHVLHGDLLAEYRRLQDAGRLEIVTCTATHGFLPLMNHDRAAMKAQVSVAAADYRRIFGRTPPGIWLAECGYFPGCDDMLAEEGIRYFFVDTHGILDASARPVYGVFAPIYCPGSGVAAFGRDPESSKQVWSSKEGYPGDFDYREYYRDIGWDLDLDYVAPYIHPDGIRLNTGLKYHRITGDTPHKQPYNPDRAREKAAAHAANFVFNRQAQARWLAPGMDRPPNIVSPYDAELFGHWWFEGPWFLEALARHIHQHQDEIALTTPGRYLDANPENQEAQPSLSSWGDQGFATFWCNETNEWIYRYLHHAAARMADLARANPEPDDLRRRALNQAGRELLLAQGSDWAFIMRTGTVVDYAVRRTRDHLHAFSRLDDMLSGRAALDADWLAGREAQWRIFPQLDYRAWSQG
jgi:1,4-alpha-glucan branching enzyme